ncbi:hypothetical protein [Nonomuraea longicatena]|uniref:Uncharacterized protein n=1 Tax=Nonomuraea longicatena TaxID=83682 RepID=A0ABN1QYF7_9ACTN
MPARYHSVTAPSPVNKSGKATITARAGGAYEMYLCVGSQRIPLTLVEAWAAWVALGNALTTGGPVPGWAASQITHPDTPPAKES